mgnify:CR=1 FL=1
MPVLYGAVIDPSDQSLLLREPDTSKAYVLDTNVLIDIVAGTPLQVPTNSDVNISSLSLVELAAPNHMDVSVAEAVLNSIGVQDVVSVSREIAVMASELRKVQPLDPIDARIAAMLRHGFGQALNAQRIGLRARKTCKVLRGGLDALPAVQRDALLCESGSGYLARSGGRTERSR